RPRYLLAAALFIVTVVTTAIAGALYQGADIIHHPARITQGIPFSASLLLILVTHELGHYIASKRHGVTTTLPMFIPGPPIPPMIGTFGAVIRIKSPITTKKALVDIGAAGPLSGFIIALFVMAWGLKMSTIVPKASISGSLGLGSSLVFHLVSYVTVGPLPEGRDIMLHPVAFSGWIGLFVTAMNLLPIGQLDGGHIVYAILGHRHRVFSFAMVGALLILGMVSWPGWFIWAVLISVIGMWHPPVEDQHVPLDMPRKLVCLCAAVVFVLTFMPTPFYII
ncbi:MAG: site-2 protease family protein, partial [Deltaproteobacteria bacterium]